ncbi:hypothetical protein PAMA_012026 [Pampus argenteus]
MEETQSFREQGQGGRGGDTQLQRGETRRTRRRHRALERKDEKETQSFREERQGGHGGDTQLQRGETRRTWRRHRALERKDEKETQSFREERQGGRGGDTELQRAGTRRTRGRHRASERRDKEDMEETQSFREQECMKMNSSTSTKSSVTCCTLMHHKAEPSLPSATDSPLAPLTERPRSLSKGAEVTRT